MELDQLSGNSETEPRAVVRTRRRSIDLRKLAENHLVVVAGDAAAGITNLYACHPTVGSNPGKRDPDSPAVIGELDGVSDQIAEHVLHLVPIGVNRRHVVTIEPLDGEMLPRRERVIKQANLIDELRQREVRSYQGDLVTRRAHVRENLVDHIEQLVPTAQDSADAVSLLRVELTEHPVAKNLRVGDNRSQRSPQVVRDVGQELRLQLVTRAQLVDGALRLLGDLLERDDALSQKGSDFLVGHGHIVPAAASVANVSDSTESRSC